MKLKTVKLEYTEAEKSETEIIFNVISSRGEENDLLLLMIPNPPDNDRAQTKIFAVAKRVIKNLHQGGHISYYAVPDNFTREDTVCQYIYNKFPETKDILPTIESGKEFILLRV